jgi:hypothetical protein
MYGACLLVYQLPCLPACSMPTCLLACWLAGSLLAWKILLGAVHG